MDSAPFISWALLPELPPSFAKASVRPSLAFAGLSYCLLHDGLKSLLKPQVFQKLALDGPRLLRPRVPLQDEIHDGQAAPASPTLESDPGKLKEYLIGLCLLLSAKDL
jgi:hypothetical protein